MSMWVGSASSGTDGRGAGGIRLLMAALYPFLAVLPFPPFNWHWVSFVAVTPLVVIAATRPRKGAFLAAFLGSLLFYYMSLRWLRFYAAEALFLVPAYLALYAWAFCLIVAKLDRIRPGSFLWSAPLVWTGLEMLRGRIFGGFGWFELGQGTWGLSHVIQIADLGGVALISLLAAAVGTAVAGIMVVVFRLREDGGPGGRRAAAAAIVSVGLLAASIAYGAWRLGQASMRSGPKVCLVQCNISMSGGLIEDEPADILRKMLNLTTDAMREEPDVDLVVWPETMMPGELRLATIPLLASGDPIERLATDDMYLDFSNELARFMRQAVAEKLKCSTLVGWHVGGRDTTGSRRREFNSAVLLSEEGAYVGRYDKMHLVPFGEFIPLRRFLPFVVRLIEKKVGQAPNLTPGEEATVLNVARVPFGVTICYEDTFPRITRALVRGGARFMVNLTNDAWFENTVELDMHAAICVFRAVENRIPVVRSANTGVSCIIDSCGRIVDRVQDRFGFYREVEGALVGRVELDDRRTLYTAAGDVTGWACLVLTAILVGVLVWRRLSRRQSAAGRRRS